MSTTHRVAIVAGLAIGLIGSSALALAGSAAAASSGQTCYFGECGEGPAPRTPVVASPRQGGETEVKKICVHGSWTVLAYRRSVMIVDEFDDGSKFAIFAPDNGKVGLFLSNSHWHLSKGRSFRMTITIDGESYGATVTAIDETTLSLDNVSREFLQAFYHGDRAVVSVGDYKAEMQSLPDAAKAIDDAVRYQQVASR